jgi:hypothetical protein
MGEAEKYKNRKVMKQPILLSIVSHSTGAVVGYKAMQSGYFPLDVLANVYNLAGPT